MIKYLNLFLFAGMIVMNYLATALLVNYNWNGFGISEEIWTIIMISAGALIAAITLFRFNNPFIGLSVVWAFIGITIKRQDDYRSIVITAIIALSMVGIITIWGFIRNAMHSESI